MASISFALGPGQHMPTCESSGHRKSHRKEARDLSKSNKAHVAQTRRSEAEAERRRARADALQAVRKAVDAASQQELGGDVSNN